MSGDRPRPVGDRNDLYAPGLEDSAVADSAAGIPAWRSTLGPTEGRNYEAVPRFVARKGVTVSLRAAHVAVGLEVR
ncbi:hypothetical protein ACWGR4_30495 [Embleya sp. NPDC055664]